MTTIENNLALHIIKENYGDLAKQICNLLINKKSYPLLMIATDLNLSNKLVKSFFKKNSLIIKIKWKYFQKRFLKLFQF